MPNLGILGVFGQGKCRRGPLTDVRSGSHNRKLLALFS